MNQGKKQKRLCLLGLFLMAIFVQAAFSQSIGGTIQGLVTTESDEPISSATIYVSSSSLPGIQIALTEKSGNFDVPGLPVGIYTLIVEKPGFKTSIIEPIEIRPNRIAFIRIKLTPAQKEGEIILARPAPGGDIYSSEVATWLDSSLIKHLPLSRDLNSLLKTSPQVALSEFDKRDDPILLGSSWKDSSYYFEGVNVTDNLTFTPVTNFDPAVIEALEITSSGQRLGQIPGGRVHINIISRSGGNAFSGDLGFSLINDGWNKDLWTSPQIQEKGIPAVSGMKNSFEPFFNLAGRFWTDRAWFFLSSRFQKYSQENIFLGPFNDVHGRLHENYDWSRNLVSGFFKITLRPIAEAQASAWVNLSRIRQPVAESISSEFPFLSTHKLDHDSSFNLHASGHYFLDRKTIIEAKASYFRRNSLFLLQEEASASFWSDDAGDRYGPLTGADYNSEAMVEQLHGGAEARRFVSNWGGVQHILKAGFGFLQTTAYVDWWRANNLLWFLDSRRANNYYFPNEGLVGFWLCGAAKTSTVVRGQTQRLGGYFADTITIGHRLTLDFSLRLDRASGGFSGASKTTSGNPLAYFVGEAFVKPYTQATYPDTFVGGLNPWGTLLFSDRGDIISWLTLSPRLGLVLNLWGEGKTLLKASWARYHDDLTPRDLLLRHPLYPGNISFFWLDANGDGRPESGDEFFPLSFDFRSLSNDYFDKRIAEDISSPKIDEISSSIEQFINKNLSLSFKFIARKEKNIPADVLYDLNTGETWYEPDQGQGKKYWLPFTTTIPANGDFPAQTVTFYVRSKEAPPLFKQWRNVPDLERKYRAYEFNLDKKMAQGWGLLATLILSRIEGNINGLAQPFSGILKEVIDANYFINRYGRLETDRPVLFKLQGVVELPWAINLSAFYQYQSGRPWERRGRILPPANWCEKNGGERIYYSVWLEPAGNRREASFSFLDVRLEKALKIGDKSRLWLTLDILNLLGSKREIVGLNDNDIWEPSAEGNNQSGRLFLSPDFKSTKELLGKRIFRFHLRLAF